MLDKGSTRWLVACLCVLLAAIGGCSLQVYDGCRKKAQTLDDMDGCMSANGYAFVLQDAAWNPSIGECWDDRYASKIPMAYCYVQVAPPMAGANGP